MDEAKAILKDINSKEGKILQEQKVLQEQTKRISKLETLLRTLVSKEKEIVVGEERVVSSELNFFQKFFVGHAKKHKIIYQIIIVLAVVLVWRGLWDIFDTLPVISSAFASLAIGLVILWLFNRMTDLN